MSMTRRDILRAAGVAATATGIGLAPGTAAQAAGEPRRVDTHHHAVPEDMRQWAISRGLLPPVGGPSWALWTEGASLQVMRDNGIAAAVVSAPVPSFAFDDPALAEEGARICNESHARLVAKYPNRFGFFAYVTAQHIDLALGQVAYALDELGAEGVILMTNAGGRYLGDPAFDPLFAELNRRHAVVFTHPGALPDTEFELPGVSNSLADFLFDTTRAALNMIANGTLDRYPDVSIILSHGGGFLPYMAARAESQGRQGEFVDPAAVRRALRRFYYDTALPTSPAAMPSLLTVAGPSQVLYGTDYAARPATDVGVITADLDRDPAVSDRALAAINHRNALRLFPRLRARLGH